MGQRLLTAAGIDIVLNTEILPSPNGLIIL